MRTIKEMIFLTKNKERFVKLLLIMMTFLIYIGSINAQDKPIFEERAIFSAKLDGVNNFRIPSIITLPSGTVLALCEARYGGDKSPTDLVLRRSLDNGESWGKIETILKGQGGAIMNPTPVFDESNGTLWLFVNYLRKTVGYDRLWAVKSLDEGVTWSDPIDLTPDLGPVHIGPATGVQLKNGRLIIPGRDGDEDTKSLVVYSDDSGKTWKKGDLAKPDTNESQAVELADGKLMINMRSENGSGLRGVAISDDGGETWSQAYDDSTLIDPVVQATIKRYSLKEENGKNRILFANPAQSERGNRTNMTVRLSYDEGKTWPVSKVIHEGPSAYSNLTVMEDGTIGLLYEGGEKSAYEEIRFAKFNLEWLTNGSDYSPR